MALLLEISIRVALIAASTAALLWALRIKTAATRHAAWTFVVIAMLLLPLWSAAGLKLSVRVLPAPAQAEAGTFVPPAPSSRVEHIGAAAPEAIPASEPVQPFDWQRALLVVYALGAGVLLSRLIVGTVRANRLRRGAVADQGLATSELCTTPVTVGFLRPALILPASWRRWPSGQLNAVLTHESEHVRRHDPLVQWLALINRAVFWFHPLSWWLERRLATLAEEACDAAVLAAGHSPEEYSEYLLEMAREISREGNRVRVVGMAMPGHGLKPRLRQILEGAPAPPSSPARVGLVLASCVAASALSAAASLAPRALSNAAGQQRFDVASIKVDNEKAPPTLRATPTGILYTGVTLRRLLVEAYGVTALSISAVDARVTEGLDDRQRYEIEAKAGHEISATQRQQMLQSLLADRFKLAVHRAAVAESIYRLSAAPGGVTLQESTEPGDAVCSTGAQGGVVCRHMTMSGFAEVLASHMGRVVVDDTKLAGAYDFTLKLNGVPGIDDMKAAIASSPDPGAAKASLAAAMNDWTASSILSDIQKQLGLKLDADRAPVAHLVVDHVERPTPNDEFATTPAPVQATAAKAAATFDVASIKPCTDVPRALAGRRGGLKTIDNTANRLFLECISLESLADLAYTRNGDFVLNDHIEDAVRGGPDWVRSDRFTVEATASGSPGVGVMMGPMLRALLEDRFQLRVHNDTIEVPMYALTVAKDGPKIKPMAPGDCTAEDPNSPPTPEMFDARKKPQCGSMRGTSRGSVKVWDFGGISMSDLANTLDSDRPILDKTGLKGNFLVHLEYERDDKVVDGVNLFAALERQLGLKLISIKGPQAIAVIDRVERLRPDSPAETAITGVRASGRARR